jgi:subtilisin family serine protease
MKKFTLLFVLALWILSINPTTAQQVLFKNQSKDSVIRNNPRMAGSSFVPGEMIVKFKDNVSVKSTGTKLKSASAVTNTLQTKYNVKKAEALFPGATRLKSVQMLTAPNGQKFIRPSLHNIYKLKIADEKQLMSAINDFKADTANVVYAEPNYIISICNDKPVGPILTEADVQKMQQAKPKTPLKGGNGPIVNDPMYSQQWYIPAVKADLVWPQTMGDTTQVIAILDTGVDWLHPDLKNKIWKNPNPYLTPGPDGIVNDIRGWDYINNRNNPMDDNSHGTHVAGIAAAEANNGIGIAGVCPKAKIMPIKVFQSSGRGDASTIAKGINYAATHGATVINMSFGSYARSQAMEDVLANAYATCALVAAAGNDNTPIGPGKATKCNEENLGVPFFPAALSYVLGVQSPDACFSNYDQDGSTFSAYDDLLNYEMKAPGTNILSTVPNGGYRIYQGTSMAAPIISGAVSLYRKLLPNDSQELMWVKFIQATGQYYIDIQKTLAIIPKSEIHFLNNVIVDTLANDDKDGRVDAGETIQLWFKVENTGNQVDSAYCKIGLAEFEDRTICDFVKSTSFLGSISSYATKANQKDPFKFIVNKKVKNERQISFNILSWIKGSNDTVKQNFVLTVENGSQLSGVMDSTLTLTPDKLWLVNQSFKIGSNGKLIFKPGTKLIATKKIFNSGQMIGIGTKDSLIFIKGICIQNGSFNFTYTNFDLNIDSTPERAVFSGTSGMFNYCNFTLSGTAAFENLGNTILNNCNFSFTGTWFNTTIDGENGNLIFKNSNLNESCYAFSSAPNFENCNLITMVNHDVKINPDNFKNCNLLEKRPSIGGITGDIHILQPNIYFGTIDSAKIATKIIDFFDDPSFALINFIKNLVTVPFDSSHCIVWKILVNGKDAQDEVVDPVGVGKQRFDVYFNRPMNKSIIPQVSFGVRDPYGQQVVNENGIWSQNGKIYTVYKTIKLTTGDGINHIRVSGAKEKDGWDNEIPVENSRFGFLISAAGSASADFMATPGLGKVKLEWNNAGLKDLMGFNMYRMEHITDTTLTKPTLVNTTLITDTLYTDFSVIPNKKYYYFYKVVRTDMSESDSSKVVTATPFTASKGDANGDLTVNVLDITTIVAYLLGQNPTPFIFDAADVNGDKAVNVLDVVSVANIIKGSKSAPATTGKNYNPTLAYITLKPEIIQLKSDAQVQAVQFEFQGVDLEKVHLSAVLKGFELAYSIDSNKIKGVLYNLNGLTIPAGISDIIKIEAGAGKLTWGNVFGADPQGRYVTIMTKEDVSLTTATSPFGLSVQPNPSGSDMHIGFTLPETAYVTVKVFNLLGEMVSQVMDNTLFAGSQQVIWNGSNSSGKAVKPGVYFIRVEARSEKNIRKEYIKVVRF